MKKLFSDGRELVSFEEFMAYALHDPQHGYYAHRISTVGRGGDFTTTAEISPALAKAIAHWLDRHLRETKCRHVIELGPGRGALAAAVRQAMSWHRRWRTQWHLVETSSTLRAIQQRRPELRRAHWHDSIEEALEACGGVACLYSNEFFDAFPVRLFQRAPLDWQEVFLTQQMQEQLRVPLSLPDSSVWQQTWQCGQRVEVHESVQRWLQSLGRQWQRGAMLTIDYGAEVSELYQRQMHGSVRAYLAQQRLVGEAIYQNIGRQDLTADVNFTDLMEWSKGFASEQSLCTQAEFLTPFVDAANAGDRYSIDPWGAGEAFRVWDCSRTGEPIGIDPVL